MVKCDNCGKEGAQNPIMLTNTGDKEILCEECYREWTGLEPEPDENIWSVS